MARSLFPAAERRAAPLAVLDLKGLQLSSTQILGPMSLTLWPGDTLALQGPSGIGKSTLLRILAGLETRFDGTLRFGSECFDPERLDPQDVAPKHGNANSRVTRALVFQDPTLLPWRNALQNLTLVTGCSEHTARAALADVGLAEEMIALVGQVLKDRRLTCVLVTHAAAEARALATRQITLAGRPARICSDRAL